MRTARFSSDIAHTSAVIGARSANFGIGGLRPAYDSAVSGTVSPYPVRLHSPALPQHAQRSQPLCIRETTSWASLFLWRSLGFVQIGYFMLAQTYCGGPNERVLEPSNQTGYLMPDLRKQWPALSGEHTALFRSAPAHKAASLAVTLHSPCILGSLLFLWPAEKPNISLKPGTLGSTLAHMP